MTNSQISITRILRHIRTGKIKNDLYLLGWILYASILSLVLLGICIESVFYLPANIRLGTWNALLGVASLCIIFIIIILFRTFQNKIYRFRLSTIARNAGVLSFPKKDTVLNALQLERNLSQSMSHGLSQSFIQEVFHKLTTLELKDLFPNNAVWSGKKTTLTLLILVALSISIFWNHSSGAVYRWIHPRTKFAVPKPFVLESVTKDIRILGGESVSLSIKATSALPDTVFLSLTPLVSKDMDSTQTSSLLVKSSPDSSKLYTFVINDIYHDYSYQAFVPADHFWQTWKKVSSNEYRILVTDRPTMEDFSITVIPPKYSQLKPQIQAGNQANVRGLKGSTISIKLSSNRVLEKSFLLLGDNEIQLTSRGKRAQGEFLLHQNGMFTVHLLDERGITNRNPIPYHLEVIPDLFPDLNIIAPPPVIELGENQLLPLHLEIEDDFGFSTLQIGYELRRPTYLQTDPFISIFTIPDLIPEQLHQKIYTIWNLSDLGLMPEDEVHFHFELYDNDEVSGPKKTLSGTFIARLPSLADLFTAMREKEQNIIEETEIQLEKLNALQEHLEKTDLELLKSEEISWEQQQEIKKILKEASEKIEQLKKLTEAIETLEESGEKHGLFSEDLVVKFQELQNLVNELISEDLLMNMDEVRNALENMDMKDLMSAMDQLSQNMEQIEQELDRFIDILKRIQAEQMTYEITKRLEQLVKEQDVLNDNIQQTNDTTDPSKFSRLEQEEKRNLEEFQNILDIMEDASDLMEEYSKSSSEAMENLSQSELAEETEADLSESANQLGEEASSSSKQFSRSALKNLQSFHQMALNIQQQFQQETTSEMVGEFQSIMQDILTLSKSQESLHETTSGIPRNSPRIKDLAVHQQMLSDQLTQVMSALMDLSKKTFAVTPQIGKSLGRASAEIKESIGNLAERKGNNAKSHQALAMKSLNEAALEIYNTIQQMQSGGSASGFEQFLAQMEALSGQQQSINSQGMQLAFSQLAASAQQAMMQQMLSGQEQVQKSLQELMNEMAESGHQGLGDMSGAAQEMEEVIKDLKSRKYSRKTYERQERILSRMLDSQKSLTRRGQKEERLATTANQNNVFIGPSGLPVDLGQRQSIAIEALNQAMKAGYSRDYQTMIRRYFNALGQASFLETSKEPENIINENIENE